MITNIDLDGIHNEMSSIIESGTDQGLCTKLKHAWYNTMGTTNKFHSRTVMEKRWIGKGLSKSGKFMQKYFPVSEYIPFSYRGENTIIITPRV